MLLEKGFFDNNVFPLDAITERVSNQITNICPAEKLISHPFEAFFQQNRIIEMIKKIGLREEF